MEIWFVMTLSGLLIGTFLMWWAARKNHRGGREVDIDVGSDWGGPDTGSANCAGGSDGDGGGGGGGCGGD